MRLLPIVGIPILTAWKFYQTLNWFAGLYLTSTIHHPSPMSEFQLQCQPSGNIAGIPITCICKAKSQCTMTRRQKLIKEVMNRKRKFIVDNWDKIDSVRMEKEERDLLHLQSKLPNKCKQKYFDL